MRIWALVTLGLVIWSTPACDRLWEQRVTNDERFTLDYFGAGFATNRFRVQSLRNKAVGGEAAIACVTGSDVEIRRYLDNEKILEAAVKGENGEINQLLRLRIKSIVGNSGKSPIDPSLMTNTYLLKEVKEEGRVREFYVPTTFNHFILVAVTR